MKHNQPKTILSWTSNVSFIANFLSSKIVKYLVVMGDTSVSSCLMSIRVMLNFHNAQTLKYSKTNILTAITVVIWSKYV